MKRYKEENIIGRDFQGWPLCKMSLREILEELGFEKMENEGNVYWRIADKDPILDVFPRTLEDDGMGYGVNEKLIVSAGVVAGKDGEKFINIFIEPDQRNEEDLDSKN